MNTKQINAFLKKLIKLGQPELCFNPYNSGDTRRDEIRCENLRLYLKEMAQAAPRVMLVGEAPGYNGCHWSGIPFTSERQLVRGVENHGIYGEGKGYRWTSDKEKGYTEPSGTILWNIISELPSLPLVWNAFPLHPFKAGKDLSNRTPRDTELQELSWVLHDLSAGFGITQHIAIGRKAESVLALLGIQAPGVRHPANGGKNACREGLLNILDKG